MRALLRKLVDCPTLEESEVILDVLRRRHIPTERHLQTVHTEMPKRNSTDENCRLVWRILVPISYLKAAIAALQKALEESKSHAG